MGWGIGYRESPRQFSGGARSNFCAWAPQRDRSERVKITLIPGNHDYELAFHPGFVERLAEYGIAL